MKAKIMTHMVSHYPNREASIEVAKALIDGGAAYLEIQFPFSDPSADGPAIQEACTGALGSGFTVEDGFRLVKEVGQLTDLPIFIMSYASLVYAKGINEFCRKTKDAGAVGLIVPDLPFDQDEGLYQIGKQQGLSIVPVLVPNISSGRLSILNEMDLPYIYAALRVGITGSHTEISQESFEFLNRISGLKGRVLAGFGIDNHNQVNDLKDKVHSLIVGSALVRVVTANKDKEITELYKAVKSKLESLLNS